MRDVRENDFREQVRVFELCEGGGASVSRRAEIIRKQKRDAVRIKAAADREYAGFVAAKKCAEKAGRA